MALTAPTRVAVITRRGRLRTGLAQSRVEACRWMEDAIRYRAAGATDRAIVSIQAPPGSARPAIGIRGGTPYDRLRDWLAAPASPRDPRSPRREAVIARVPAGSCARTLIALRTGLIVTLTGPADEGGRPLDRFLRVQAARSNASLSDIVLVMHVADRLSPWIAVSPPGVGVERF